MVASLRVPRGQGRNELIAATLRLIARRGVRAITMRDIAAEAGLSLGSTSYHFADRARLIASALDAYVANTEHDIDVAVTTSARQDRDGRGVHAAITSLFSDRGQVLIRYELRGDAARDGTHGDLDARCRAALLRLIAAARLADRRPVTDADVWSTLATLEASAIDEALNNHDAGAFTAAMRRRIIDNFRGAANN